MKIAYPFRGIHARYIVLGILLFVSLPALGDTWITVSGLSHHFENRNYCETNPGLGVEYSTGNWRLAAGEYRNSFCRTSWYGGVTYLPIRLGPAHLGLLSAIVSGYSSHGIFVPFIPAVSIEGKTFGVNLLYAPKRDGSPGVIGLQFKVRW